MTRLPRPDDEIPRQSVWALIPRRSLVKVVLLLALLVTIIFFQRHADRMATFLNRSFAPLTGSSPPASQTETP